MRMIIVFSGTFPGEFMTDNEEIDNLASSLINFNSVIDSNSFFKVAVWSKRKTVECHCFRLTLKLNHICSQHHNPYRRLQIILYILFIQWAVGADL